MTKKLGYQRKVYSKERALEYFIESDFIDWINAFPLLKEGATWLPDLLFINLDLEGFESEKSFTTGIRSNTEKYQREIKRWESISNCLME